MRDVQEKVVPRWIKAFPILLIIVITSIMIMGMISLSLFLIIVGSLMMIMGLVLELGNWNPESSRDD